MGSPSARMNSSSCRCFRFPIAIVSSLPAVPPDNDPRCSVRKCTADARGREFFNGLLGEIGPLSSDAVPALIQAVRDVNSQCRTEAAEALGSIGFPAKAALPVLL